MPEYKLGKYSVYLERASLEITSKTISDEASKWQEDREPLWAEASKILKFML